MCDECWEKRPTDVIQIVGKPEEVETPSFAETIGVYAQMALLQTKPKENNATNKRKWIKSFRAKDMSMRDIESQLQSRNLDITGTDSEKIDRLQNVLEDEERLAAAANGVFFCSGVVKMRAHVSPTYMIFCCACPQTLACKFKIISSP